MPVPFRRITHLLPDLRDAGNALDRNFEDLDDRVEEIRRRTGFSVRRSATQTVDTATTTDISFDTEDFDSDDYGSVPGVTFTVPPERGGLYTVTLYVELASSTTNTLAAVLVIAGAQYPVDGTGNFARQTATFHGPLTDGTTIKAQVFHRVGSSVGVQAILHAYRTGL